MIFHSAARMSYRALLCAALAVFCAEITFGQLAPSIRPVPAVALPVSPSYSSGAARRPTTSAVVVQLSTYCTPQKDVADDSASAVPAPAVGSKLLDALKIIKETDADRFEHVKKSLIALAEKNPNDGTPLLGIAFCRLIEDDKEGVRDSLDTLAAWIDKQETEIDDLNKKEDAKPEDNNAPRDDYGNIIKTDFWDRIPDDVYLAAWIVAREVLARRGDYKDSVAQAEGLLAFSGGYVRYKAGNYDPERGERDTDRNDLAVAAAFARELERTATLPPATPVSGIRAANLAELMMQIANIHFTENEKPEAEEIAKKIATFMPDRYARSLQLYAALLSKIGLKNEAADWTGKYLALRPELLFRDFYRHQRKYVEAGRTDKLVALLMSLDDKTLARNLGRFSSNISSWMQEERAKKVGKEMFDHLWNLKNVSSSDRGAIRADLMGMMLHRKEAEWYPYLHEVVFTAIRVPEPKKDKENGTEKQPAADESEDVPVADSPFDSVPVAPEAMYDGDFEPEDDSEESVYRSSYGRNLTIHTIRNWLNDGGTSLSTALLNNKDVTPEKLEELKKETAEVLAAHEKIDPAERSWNRYVFAKVFDAMIDLRLKNIDAALATVEALEKEAPAKAALGPCLLALGFELIPFPEKAAIDRAIACFEKAQTMQTSRSNAPVNAVSYQLIALYLKSDAPERGKKKGIAELRENIGLLKKMGNQSYVNIDNRHYDSGSVQNNLFRVLTILIDGGCSQDVLRVYMRDCRGQTWFNDLVKSRNYNYKMKDIQQKFDALIEKATVEDMAENIDLLVPMLPEEGGGK